MWIHPRYAELTGREPPGASAAGDGPPAPGLVLAALPRQGPAGSQLELRVVLDQFNGHQYIAVRVWQRGRDGAWWPVKGKGVSVRLAEAVEVAEALLQAVDQAGDSRPDDLARGRRAR